MSLLDIVFFALPFSGWLGATRATASNRPGACTPAPACVVGSQRPTATVSAQSILFSPTRTLAKLTKSQGANRGPNDDRLWATPGDFQPQSLQLNAPIGRNRATSRDGSNVPSKQRVAGSNPAGRAHFAPRNPWRQTVARAGCHSTLHTVFTSSVSRPQVMLATLGYRQHPQAALQ